MVTIGITNLHTSKSYLRRYLQWATSYADEIPEGLVACKEFGVLWDDGTLRIVVPLENPDGVWVATGIGPLCHRESWELPMEDEN